VDLNGLVELGGSGLADKTQGVRGIILHGAVDLLRAVFILFTSKQFNVLLKVVMRKNPPTF
jgi:hypothetical protein